MTTMRDAYQNWEPPELPTHFDAFSAGWKAAIAAVKAGGVVAFADCLGTVRTQHELDKLKRFCDERYRTYDRPLYKLPEEMK